MERASRSNVELNMNYPMSSDWGDKHLKRSCPYTKAVVEQMKDRNKEAREILANKQED